MTPADLTRLIDTTWPAASFGTAGGFTIREGRGAGSRVSAATADTPGTGDIDAAEAAMQALGQTPIFMVRAGEDALDAALAARGYRIKDPVTFYDAPTATLTDPAPPPVTAFEIWPPLAAQREIWRKGGVPAAKFDVMERVAGPRTTILGRQDDTPAGTIFVAITGDTAMMHMLEVAARFRRCGLARHLVRATARWAARQGAGRYTLLTTNDNTAANALYASLGMRAAAGYHYRTKDA